jgi:hypothetical protein
MYVEYHEYSPGRFRAAFFKLAKPLVRLPGGGF